MSSNLATPLSAIIADIADRRPFVVFDDSRPEFIAILSVAAESVTEANLELLRRAARGPISVMMPAKRLKELGLSGSGNTEGEDHQIGWTASVNLRKSRLGITLRDQVDTIRALCDPAVHASDFVRPGTVVPYECDDLGVLRKRTPSVAARDLVNAAGLYPTALASAILDDVGALASPEYVMALLEAHSIRAVSIEDVVRHQWEVTQVVTRPVDARLPTSHGMFRVYGSSSVLDDGVVAALVHGETTTNTEMPIYVHRGDLVADVFGSTGCDCAERLNLAIAAVARARAGILIYLRAPLTTLRRPDREKSPKRWSVIQLVPRRQPIRRTASL